jgi:hypothetical protein
METRFYFPCFLFFHFLQFPAGINGGPYALSIIISTWRESPSDAPSNCITAWNHIEETLSSSNLGSKPLPFPTPSFLTLFVKAVLNTVLALGKKRMTGSDQWNYLPHCADPVGMDSRMDST